MSDPTPSPPPPPPAGIMGLATSALDMFRNSPILLMVLLLNMLFVLGMGYYLLKIEAYRSTDRVNLLDMLEKCLNTPDKKTGIYYKDFSRPESFRRMREEASCPIPPRPGSPVIFGGFASTMDASCSCGAENTKRR